MTTFYAVAWLVIAGSGSGNSVYAIPMPSMEICLSSMKTELRMPWDARLLGCVAGGGK